MVSFSRDNGVTKCTITYKDKEFIGIATCAPEDTYKDSIGERIAMTRAEIEYFRFVRDYELAPKYSALRQLYYSVNRSKNYNEHSYEARAIRRQMYQAKEDLDFVKGEIAYNKDSLRCMFRAMKYIEDKKG